MSMRDFATDELKKDMIGQLLSNSFPFIDKSEYPVMTELVLEKLSAMSNLRAVIAENDASVIGKVAEANGVEKDAVLDSFIYFYLITENVYLTKALLEKVTEPPEEDDD
jgi:hypothetical protein